MAKPSIVKGIILINPLTGTDLDLSWDANPEGDILGYNIFRSLGPETGFIKINTSLIVITSFRDTTATQQSRTDYWYFIRAVNVGLEESDQSQVVVNELRARLTTKEDLTRLGDNREMNHQKILQEISRRNEILLRRGGEDVDIYIRKTAGPRCSCFDIEREQSDDPNCPDCFGTTFEGGYEPVRDVLMKVLPTSQTLTATELGAVLAFNPRAWLTTFPLIRSGDVGVRKSNNGRFQIRDVTQQISRGLITRQEFTMVNLLPTEFPQIFNLS